MSEDKEENKKIDKEVQLPMQRVFKELIQMEKVYPEKEKLLREKQSDKAVMCTRKKKKMKSVKSCTSDRRIPYPYNQNVFLRENGNCETLDGYHIMSANVTCGCSDGGRETNNYSDTCSCYSCAIKRILTSDYSSIGCLLLVFLISLVIAFVLIYCNTPCAVKIAENYTDYGPDMNLDTLKFKKTIENLARLKKNDEGVELWRNTRDSPYDNIHYGALDMFCLELSSYIKGIRAAF